MQTSSTPKKLCILINKSLRWVQIPRLLRCIIISDMMYNSPNVNLASISFGVYLEIKTVSYEHFLRVNLETNKKYHRLDSFFRDETMCVGICE